MVRLMGQVFCLFAGDVSELTIPHEKLKEIYIYIYLVGGLEHALFHRLGRILPTDEVIFFRGIETTNQIYIYIKTCLIDDKDVNLKYGSNSIKVD